MRRLFIYIFLVAFFQSCETEREQRNQSDLIVNILSIPADINAGNNIELSISSNQKATALLLFDGAFGIQTFDLFLEEGETNHIISGELTKWSGLASVLITNKELVLSEKQINILPLKPHDPMEIYAGPKTIWNDRKQPSMLVAISRDSLQNISKEGTKVDFQFRYPNGQLYELKSQTSHLLSAAVLEGNQASGEIAVGISDEGSFSSEQRIDIVPSWPRKIEIELIDHVPYADNRHFASLRTKKLIDEVGEQIPDGTLVHFNIISDKGNVSLYRAFTIDGMASVFIKNPSYATLWNVSASIGSVIKSNTLKLFFESPIKQIKYRFLETNNELAIGPLVSYLDQYVADGMKVYVSIGDLVIVEETDQGFVKINLNQYDLPKGLLDLKIMVSDKQIVDKLNLD